MSVGTIGVVGAGTLGTSIAQAAAGAGFQVILIDVNETALSKAMDRIGSGFDRLVAKRQMSPEAKQGASSLITTGTEYAALTPADLFVEAATENVDVKEKIVRAVDKVVRDDAITGTNTSSVSIARLAVCISNDRVGRRFATVARLSEVNESLYQTFVRPAVRAVVNPAIAAAIREMHPNRCGFGFFSDRNRFVAAIAPLAEAVRQNRLPAAQNNPLFAIENLASGWIETSLKLWGQTRDALVEQFFLNLYGSPLLQSLAG